MKALLTTMFKGRFEQSIGVDKASVIAECLARVAQGIVVENLVNTDEIWGRFRNMRPVVPLVPEPARGKLFTFLSLCSDFILI